LYGFFHWYSRIFVYCPQDRAFILAYLALEMLELKASLPYKWIGESVENLISQPWKTSSLTKITFLTLFAKWLLK